MQSAITVLTDSLQKSLLIMTHESYPMNSNFYLYKIFPAHLFSSDFLSTVPHRLHLLEKDSYKTETKIQNIFPLLQPCKAVVVRGPAGHFFFDCDVDICREKKTDSQLTWYFKTKGTHVQNTANKIYSSPGLFKCFERH